MLCIMKCINFFFLPSIYSVDCAAWPVHVADYLRSEIRFLLLNFTKGIVRGLMQGHRVKLYLTPFLSRLSKPQEGYWALLLGCRIAMVFQFSWRQELEKSK